jgi:hypothetical protein
MSTTMADDMKKLTEEMRAASAARRDAVGTLLAQTRDTLKEFGADRTQMAADQARDLAAFVGGLSQSVQEIRRGARDTLEEFGKANRQMSQDQSQRLADYAQSLARDVTSMMSRFGQEQAHMSQELGERLDQEIAEIKGAVEQILKDAADCVNEQHAGRVQARQAWRQMGATLGRAKTAGAPVAGPEGDAAAKHK